MLQSVVETAVRICNADKAAIYSCIMACFVLRPRSASRRSIRIPAQQSDPARTVAHRSADGARAPGVHIEDALDRSGIYDLESSKPRRVSNDAGGAAPSRGPSSACSSSPGAGRAVHRKQIALVTTFADQAVIAIENARLFNELRDRTAELGRSVDELQMLSEVGQAVSSTLDLRAVLSRS